MPSIKEIQEEAERRIKRLKKEEQVEHEFKEYAIANSIDDFAKDIHKNHRIFTPKDKLERLGQMMKEHGYARSYHEKKTEEIKDKTQKVYKDAKEKIDDIRAGIRSELKLKAQQKASFEMCLDQQKIVTKRLQELLADQKEQERDLENLVHVSTESIGNLSRKKRRIEKDIAALPPPFRRFGILPEIPPPPPPPRPPFCPPTSKGVVGCQGPLAPADAKKI